MADANRTPPRKQVQDRRGFVSGRLTVIGPHSKHGRRVFWLCQCECGGTKEVEWGSLKSGTTRSCGCLPLGSVPGKQREVADLSGRRFAMLTVIRRAKNRGHKVRWICRCDCGMEREFDISKVKGGRTQSCGCTHNIRRGGKSMTREYRIWARMLDRCYRPAADNYRFYGGRGVIVCAGWRDSFESFLADMAVAPTPGHSIDRENPNGSYTCGHCDECKTNGWPANCRWATKAVQSRNCRKHVRMTHNGKTLLLKEWAELSGVGYHTLYSRVVVRGWPFELAISTPQGAKAGNGSPMRLSP